MNKIFDKKKMKTAIILAAGDVPATLKPFVGRTCSAMLPVNGRPIIHHSIKYLQDNGIDRVIVGIKKSEKRLPKFLKQTFGSQLELIIVNVAEDRGPGFTLLQCLKALPKNSQCLVVLGDTLFQYPILNESNISENYVLTSTVGDAERWCLAQVNENNDVEFVVDKPKHNEEGLNALIGVYHFSDSSLALEALQDADENKDSNIQISKALEPYINKKKLKAHSTENWFDCGNPDLLTSSRRKLLQARSFNSLQIDELRGTITKRSKHRSKFLNEINYYRLLPSDIATFYPRLVDHSLTASDTYLTLEYYGYGTLSEVWVFEEYDGSDWIRIFQTLQKILKTWETYTCEITADAAFNFYWNKTIDRVAAFSNQSDEFRKLVELEELNLNGNKLNGWPKIVMQLEERVKLLSANCAGQIIHGDLCFPNILFDPLSCLFKLIDPRGSFSESGIFGDPRYDVAKLMHSIDGGYDFLIHDMFTLSSNNNDYELNQFFPENRKEILKAFLDVFGQNFDLDEIRLIEGLLFVSMCALHEDNPQRQKAMFLIGLKLLNK